MKFISKFDRYITAIYLCTIITIVATSYFTFKEFFTDYNQKQQEAIIPLFSLISSEIIRPLTVSQFMANDQFLIDYIQQDSLDNQIIYTYLSNLSKQFKMLSFIALEQHNLMLDSNNKISDLNDSNVEWFHRLKEVNKQQFADIGNAKDPHLYFDVKLINNQNKFLGFVGVAVDLNAFEDMFTIFNKKYGFELYFVDEYDEVTLSSSKLMKTSSHHRKNEVVNINSLPWYEHYLANKENIDKDKVTLTISDIGNKHLIISEMPLKELNWRIFIVAPPATEQGEYWQVFIQKLIIFILIFFILYYIFSSAINYFKTSLVKDSETDYLTQLPNRSFIHWKYQKLSEKYDTVCLVIADIDNFKIINDTYGHLVGDDVLKIIATKFTQNLRSIDLVGRWGGEEFIMILPDTTTEQTQEIMNRIRVNIANIPFTSASTSQKFNITVSFGISESNLANIPLKDIIEKADKALYSAKENGRNQVVVNLN